MGLSFVNPFGFKFFIISNAIALLILSMVKSIADIIPNIDVLRFSVINGIGMLLFIGSLYIGRLTTDSKKINTVLQWGVYSGWVDFNYLFVFDGDNKGGNARVCHSSGAYSRGIHSLMGGQ